MPQTVEIRTNLPDFKAQLHAFNDRMQNNIMRSATNAAAQVFKKAVIAAAPEFHGIDRRKYNPRVPGTLKRAVYVYRHRNPARGTVEFAVSWRKGKEFQKVKGKKGTVTNKDAYYGVWLEYGWTPRGPGKAAWRAAQVGTKGRFAGRVQARRAQERARFTAIRGTVSRPFLIPGFNAARGAALAAFTTKLEERLRQDRGKATAANSLL